MQPEHPQPGGGDSPASELFRVDLRGVVEILSHHLYSSPRVFVRELLQNARDALAARRIFDEESQHTAPAGPRGIRVGVAGEYIIVEDDGIGLSTDEMRSLLATIGASSKRDDLVRVRQDFLGRFGIGLLSCFLVADSVDVLSRSARDPNAPTMRWVGRSDGTYTISDGDGALASPGTRVRLRPRPEESTWASARRLVRLANDFTRYLDVPVDVYDDRGQPTRVSMSPLPETLNSDEAAQLCHDRFGFDPLSTTRIDIPILGIHGVAFVNPNGDGSSSRAGDIVYSNGMLVAEDNTQLAPDWAYFARLIIDAGSLPLTASRESFQESPLTSDAAKHIGATLRAHIDGLSASHPDTFRHFVDAHGVGLRAMALEDPSMFRFVVDHLPFITSRGERTLRELIDGTPTEPGLRQLNTVYSKSEFRGLSPLARVQGKVIIDATHVHEPQILQRLTQANSSVIIQQLSLETLVEGAAPARDVARADAIRGAGQAALPDHDVSVVDFGTDAIAALVLPAKDDWGIDITSGGASWLSAIGEAFTDSDSTGPRLVMNIGSPLVSALAQPLDSRVRADAARAIYVLGLLHSGQPLTEDDHALLAESLASLVSAATSAG